MDKKFEKKLVKIESLLTDIPTSIYSDYDLRNVHGGLKILYQFLDKLLDNIYLSEMSEDDPIRIRIVSCMELLLKKSSIYFNLTYSS